MWWECENCGGVVDMRRAKGVCRECGTANPALAEVGVTGDRHAPFEASREAWLRAGLLGKTGGRDAADGR